MRLNNRRGKKTSREKRGSAERGACRSATKQNGRLESIFAHKPYWSSSLDASLGRRRRPNVTARVWSQGSAKHRSFRPCVCPCLCLLLLSNSCFMLLCVTLYKFAPRAYTSLRIAFSYLKGWSLLAFFFLLLPAGSAANFSTSVNNVQSTAAASQGKTKITIQYESLAKVVIRLIRYTVLLKQISLPKTMDYNCTC